MFWGLKEKVPGMLNFVFARDIKSRPNKPYTHVVLLSFVNEEAMKAYEKHPDLKAIAEKAPSIIESFFEMDY